MGVVFMDKKTFVSSLKTIDNSKRFQDVFSDFVSIMAISLSNVTTKYTDNELWKLREEEYLRIMNRYSKESQNKLSQLFTDLIYLISEKPYQDFLGELYMEFCTSNHARGQVFTPYHIAELMAKISIDDIDFETKLKEKGYITVHDPCCGSGVMLIAFADVCRQHAINYQQKVLFIAQDIDLLVAKMCFIQLSLLGCPGIVFVGNSLTSDIPMTDIWNENAWVTPMYLFMRVQSTEQIESENIPPVESQKIIKKTEPKTNKKPDDNKNKERIRDLDRNLKGGFTKLKKFLTSTPK